MNDIYKLEKAVNSYMERHRMELKYSKRNIDNGKYDVFTTHYTHLESKLIETQNGKLKVLFKVDGKVTSIYK